MTGRWRAAPQTVRGRLSLTLGLAFAAAGILLIVVVYLLVDRALAASSGLADLRVVPLSAAGQPGEEELSAVARQAQDLLSDSTMRTLTVWLSGLMVLVTVLAVLLTRWVLRSGLSRLELATDRARSVGADHPERRLRVGGPADEVRALADTIDGVLDDLGEVLDAQHRFLATASHELRTPLAMARTALDIPLAQGRVPDDLIPAVRLALRSNDRCVSVLDGLLVLARSRAEARRDVRARADLVDLSTLVSRTVAERQDGIDRARLDVTLDLAPAVVRADEVLLVQAVGNLVDNAVRYTPDSGRIRVSVAPHGRMVHLMIENDGERLDPAEVQVLREPFHRGARSRLSRVAANGDGTDQGLGLGLALVDTIVELHDGDLILAARDTGGLRVTLSIAALSAQELDPGR